MMDRRHRDGDPHLVFGCEALGRSRPESHCARRAAEVDRGRAGGGLVIHGPSLAEEPHLTLYRLPSYSPAPERHRAALAGVAPAGQPQPPVRDDGRAAPRPAGQPPQLSGRCAVQGPVPDPRAQKCRTVSRGVNQKP
jgi:hypothetical protein